MKKDNNRLREIRITKEYTKYAEGSVLMESGDTRVLCTAMVENKVPLFLRGSGGGWVSAEYAMLPSATMPRKLRDIAKGKIDGRSSEIQRLIGRALRSVVNTKALGERTIWIDCDVIQADGGTRTAAITGSFIALALACKKMLDQGKIRRFPIQDYVSAISVGKIDEQAVLDLCYEEDSNAQVDMNFVMTGGGELIEIQGTAERKPFTKDEMNAMMDLAQEGCRQITALQKQALGEEIQELIAKAALPEEPFAKKEKPTYDNQPYKVEGKIQMVIASSNPHKIQEMSDILRQFDISLLSMKEVGLENLEIQETGETFEENAMIKAREVMSRTGKIAIADDSGLAVEVLDGRPGVYSARFSGENATDQANNTKLLDLLKGVPEEQRKARFISVIALAFPDGREGCYKGLCEGFVGTEQKGEGGFGYDPLFVVKDLDKTYAQLTPEEKNAVSHRGRALGNMRKKLKDLLGE